MHAEPPHRILVVDDDPTVTEVVTGYLRNAGFAVDTAADGHEALVCAANGRPDLLVLDLMLPGIDGIEVCRRLREGAEGAGGAAEAPAVIMLTARGEEEDRVLGLEVGADDYVTKPFSPRELVLRVQAVLRRRAASTSGAGAGVGSGALLSAGGLVVDTAARRAVRGGTELSLTTREFDLLVYLMRHPGRAVSREQLLRDVWDWEFGDLSTVTVHARRLRTKIEEDPANPTLIQTVWGLGYRFDSSAEKG
ncbi:DNA-binding response regulator [Streptomyces venezuelae]|uniref:DNA-binding response regulator n=1 Tax=Streptomyces venezuelae TaxID=54571 RepID=A0A5P2D1G9_STRVZ|nr:response regulator transcription factor [Streptomyces venezuelae]QES46959.1 DNA-binding response regulator [Streptomyces venezuelae]